MEDENGRTILTGDAARDKVNYLNQMVMDGEGSEGNWGRKEMGDLVSGYYEISLTDGKTIFLAFDNTGGSFFVEEFDDEKQARIYCSGQPAIDRSGFEVG